MKKVIGSLAVLVLAACEGQQPQRILEISQPPIPVAGSQSRLPVPTSCPIYAPGDMDVDTPEAPFPDHVTIMCALDETGHTYGLVMGDAPGATLAVVPGGHEIGLYIGFDASAGFTPEKAVLDGTNPSIGAFAAPKDVLSQDCCPEGPPDNRLAAATVAVNDAGWLISLGTFDESATQVALILNTAALIPPSPTNSGSYFTRFYVNGTP